jgi:hypothetical protein
MTLKRSFVKNELVKEEFECESMGTIPVKGKGEMEVWHQMAQKQRSLYYGGSFSCAKDVFEA